MQHNTRLAALGLMATLAAAPMSATAGAPSAAFVVQSATHGAVVMDSAAPGPSKNLQAIIGHLKANPAQRLVLWLVDGEYIVSGPLFGANGANLSEQMAIGKGLIPKPLTGSQAFAIAKPAHAFLLGKSGPVLTAFEDPNCSACHAFNTSVSKDVAAGKLRVRVIPVGFLKPDSVARAATILSNKEPAAAWRANEASFKDAPEEGGYPIGKPSSEAIAQVTFNTQLLSRVDQGQVATPTILYCNKAGEAQIMRGWNPGILSQLGSAGCAP